jgi:regulation of enolase protein 1 (concanavalin A-like superfamily)
MSGASVGSADVDGEAERANKPTPKTNLDGTAWKNPLRGWNNMPKSKAKVTGVKFEMRIPPRSDCWRKTRNNVNRDNMPFHWHKVTGDFEVICKISGDQATMYDKAGLMIRVDEANWVLTGMELFNDQMNHSTCVTKDHTDWSLTPLPLNAEKVGIWFKIKRLSESFECFFSVDAKTWVLTREGIFTKNPVLYVGIIGGSPIGNGFKASFSQYQCKNI